MARKESVSDFLEVIEFKPPIDLIADEFVRTTNENVLVELVCAGNDSEASDLGDLLGTYGFNISKTIGGKENLNYTRPDDDWINKVQAKINAKDCEGIIMIFEKVTYSNKDMKHIWSKFTTKQCSKLKNKPKIFIFQTVRLTYSDGVTVLPHGRSAYDTPAEADLLIIYDRYDKENANDLMEILSQNIRLYGNREDIASLASVGFGLTCPPLILSTMTRKFFFTLNGPRGHHHVLFKKLQETKEHLKRIEKSKAQTKVKSSRGSSFRGVFDFIKNAGHTPESDNSDKASGSGQRNTSGKSTNRGPMKSDSAAGTSQKQSVAPKPITVVQKRDRKDSERSQTGGSSRPLNTSSTSLASNGSKKATGTNSKPPWRGPSRKS